MGVQAEESQFLSNIVCRQRRRELTVIRQVSLRVRRHNFQPFPKWLLTHSCNVVLNVYEAWHSQRHCHKVKLCRSTLPATGPVLRPTSWSLNQQRFNALGVNNQARVYSQCPHTHSSLRCLNVLSHKELHECEYLTCNE